jgi:hypothetical protein
VVAAVRKALHRLNWNPPEYWLDHAEAWGEVSPVVTWAREEWDGGRWTKFSGADDE